MLALGRVRGRRIATGLRLVWATVRKMPQMNIQTQNIKTSPRAGKVPQSAPRT